MVVSQSFRRHLCAAAALMGILLVVGSAQGRIQARSSVLNQLDRVFDAATSLVAELAAPDEIDLHDGREPVPVRWRASFERFATTDRHGIPPGGVVFVGSSSVDLWHDLPAQFPGRNVVQRGLGGATMADCLRHVDRLVLPSQPRVVVVYAGDNDVASGVAPERVVADARALVETVQRGLPGARFVFVSIKPSPARASLMPLIQRTNALLATYAATDPQVDFVDVFASMVDRQDHARRELFVADGLHLNAAGYALWHDAIARHLD